MAGSKTNAAWILDALGIAYELKEFVVASDDYIEAVRAKIASIAKE